MFRTLKNSHNVEDLRLLAKQRLPGPIFHYIDGAADDVQPDLLAGLLGRLAHDAVQPVGLAFELDHARAQQVVLQGQVEAALAGVALAASAGDGVDLATVLRALIPAAICALMCWIATERSLWNPETLDEESSNGERVRAMFAAANAKLRR